MIITSNESSVRFDGANIDMLVPKQSLVLVYEPTTESIDINLKDGTTMINLNYKDVESPSVSSSLELFNELSNLIN